MNQNNFLRMQIIMHEGSATTFDTNLSKLVSVVLFSSEKDMTVFEIQRELKDSYDLEFTEEEISKAIEKTHSGITKSSSKTTIIKYGKNFTSQEDLYSLESKVRDKYKRMLESNPEDEVIGLFVSKMKEEGEEISLEKFKNLLHVFLYEVFNSNKETLLLFLNKKTISQDEKMSDFTPDERRIINAFLNWENQKKDLLVYKTISYCVEYCLLNVKKGYSSYQNIFTGKKFYLDTNVILRLAGINNEERKTVISAFIKKCQENKIDIIYTNYTYLEIKETIHRNVEDVRKILNGHRMVSKRHYKYFSKPTTNLDFIEKYDEWCMRSKSDYADYKAFEKYLMKTIDDILRGFKKEDFVGFETRKADEYRTLCESLTSYKSTRRQYVNDNSISMDVNNYMYIQEKRNKTGVSFSDIKDYLISTDGILCNWGKDIIPGSIPIAVLPSVWYSLILKFKGRSTDDFKAFNLFLNLRFKVNEDKNAGQKEKILYLVQNLDEPTDLKNLILDEIVYRLDQNEDEVLNPEKVIEDATNSVILQEANKLFENQKITSMDDVQKQAEVSTMYTIAENRATNAIKRIERFKKVMDVIRVLAGVILVLGIIAVPIRANFELGKMFSREVWGYSIDGWLNIGAIVCPLLFWCFCPLVKKCITKRFNYTEIINRELAKLKKDFIKK